jgi:hypothetical protein
MGRFGLLPIALFLFAPVLPAQYVDVFPEHRFLWDDMDYNGDDTSKAIYRLDTEGALTKIDIPLPETMSLRGGPRPKIRNGKVWISNRKEILFRPLDAPSDEPWRAIFLPKGINDFREFEITSDAEAMLIGASWDRADENSRAPLRLDMHFVFDYETGAVKKTIASHDPRTLEMLERSYAPLLESKLFDCYVCRFDPYILIVGRNMGNVIRYDIDKGKATEHQIIPPEDIPEDPNVAINNGSAISWVGPLAGQDVLLLCRDGLVPLPEGQMYYLIYTNADGEDVREPVPWGHFSRKNSFRTMDLATGKVKLEGAHYRGFDAKPQRTLFERDGELIPVLDFIAGAGARAGADAQTHDGAGRTAHNPQDASPPPFAHSN